MTTVETVNQQPYTHHAYVNSSAIDEVFYDDVTQRLFVQLLSGTTAAYRDVPVGVFHDLVNPRNSAGQVWNQDVKHHYAGISSNVHLIQRDTLPTAVVTSSPVDLSSSFQTPNLTTFKVTVEVKATDVLDAVSRLADSGFKVTAVN